jgi:hypothetical protein
MSEKLFVYSNDSISLGHRALKLARQILKDEMDIQVKRNRFVMATHSYPIKLVVFEGKTKWGYFDANNYEIGLNSKISHQSNEQLLISILRHELVHYLCFIKYGAGHNPHGSEFVGMCESFGYGSDISSATYNEQEVKSSVSEQDQKVMVKVKKLLQLADGSEGHESESALLKANQLIEKYQLENIVSTSDESSQTVYLKRIINGKRRNGKHQAIYDILELFHVQPVFHSGSQGFSLEVIGELSNVEVADYVASFLDHELERLWKVEQKHNPKLKGLGPKNAFMKSLGKSFVSKILNHRNVHSDESALVALKHQLATQVQLVYPRMSYTTSTSTKDYSQAKNAGALAAMKLQIHGAIKGTKRKQLGFFKR